MNQLKRRIIELSFKHGLTHISSCLNVVDVLAEIYEKRQEHDPVVLGAGHAALALYVVLESVGKCDAEEMIHTHGTHAHRDLEHGIYVSGGSLGQAETIAVGMALANRLRNVWLVTSDGSLAEGCIWEAFRLATELQLTNLKVTVIANGLGGYGSIDVEWLKERLNAFLLPRARFREPEMEWPWLKGLRGHYVTLTKEQFQEMVK